MTKLAHVVCMCNCDRFGGLIVFPADPRSVQAWPTLSSLNSGVQNVCACIHAYIYICILCLFLDGAHLARMRARADAEFYTAVKLAEANKVL